MAKFTVVLVLALAAFQVSSGASLQKDLTARNIHETINEINKTFGELSERLSQVVVQLADKFEIVKKEVNLPGLVSELKKDIDSASVSKACSSAAKYEATSLKKFVDEATLQCSEVSLNMDDAALNKLRLQLQALLDKVTRQITKCFAENFGSFGDFAKCMDSTLDVAREELKQIKLAAEEAMSALESSLPQLEGQIVNCMSQAKEQVQQKVQNILDELHKCSKTEKAVQKQLCWPNVHNPLCGDYDYEPYF